MKKDAMEDGHLAKDGMSKEAMAPTTLTLTGSSVDLGKHLGHKVSVTARSHTKRWTRLIRPRWARPHPHPLSPSSR